MCIHHRALCPATKQIRDNVHQCFLDPGHEGNRHTCICYYRWVTEAEDPASSATQAAGTPAGVDPMSGMGPALEAVRTARSAAEGGE